MSRIITFYSYKGGVGRTAALANIGVQLSRRGHRVLLIDFDLEAPGLDLYFRDGVRSEISSERGVLPLLLEATVEENTNWRRHVQQITVQATNTTPSTSIHLSLISSGIASPRYAEMVERFSWKTFVEKHHGGPILERWRTEWKRDFDFILIDSRTGLTDTGGVCTILLPDVLVLVFSANWQSFHRAVQVVQSARAARRTLAVPRPPLRILPLPSRFDGRDEIDLANEWLETFARELKPFYDEWLPAQFSPRQILEVTKVPYVTRFSFGESLPVLTHSLTEPEWPGYYLDNATRLLDSDFRDVALILAPSEKDESVLGRLLAVFERDQFDESEMNRVIREAEQSLGETAELANILRFSGSRLRMKNSFDSAYQLLTRALAIDERILGSNHLHVAGDLGELSDLYASIGRLKESEELLKRALNIFERTYGETAVETALVLFRLAQLYQDTGRLQGAEQLFRRVLEIDQNIYGPTHLEIVTDLRALADVLQSTERPGEAEPLLRRALQISEEAAAFDPLIVGNILFNLANALHELGRIEEAESIMRRALEINERTYGSDHPEVAVDLSALSQLLQAQGRVDEVRPLLSRALDITEKRYGAEHPAVAIALNNLAQLAYSAGQLDEAEHLLRRALAIDEGAYGQQHAEVATDLHNLAILLKAAGRLDESEPLMRHALETRLLLERGIEDSPVIQTLFKHYLLLLQQMGQTEEEAKVSIASLRRSST